MKRLKTISCVLSLVGIFLLNTAYAQLHEVAFEELDSLLLQQDKNIVVFIHTDWCKFCKKMEATTFNNDSVITLLNEQFYFVKVNGETKKDIRFRNRTFSFKPSGGSSGIHELAEQLGTIKGQLNYPTISIVNKQNEIIFQYGGYLDAQALLAVLHSL